MQSHRLNLSPPIDDAKSMMNRRRSREDGHQQSVRLAPNGENVEAAGGGAESSFFPVQDNEGGIGLPVLVASNAYQK
jgi:hypothetical protein